MQYISVNHATANNLKDISIEIPLERYVVFVGKSGSGKSTLAVDVITAGYISKSKNVSIPLEPLLFKQKTFIPRGVTTISDFFNIKDYDLVSYINSRSDFSDEFKVSLHLIAELLQIDKIDISVKLSELSLTTYNKCRFFNLLLKYNNRLIIVDELGAGLTISESYKVSKCFRILVQNGYSILAVEHSVPIIENSDYVIELGPDAGVNGGEITFHGTIDNYKKTSRWEDMVSVLCQKNDSKTKLSKGVSITNINYRLFHSFDVSIPFGGIVTICGESGSGKSSLLDIIFRACDKSAAAWKNREGIDGNIEGKNNLRRPYLIDQIPIGNNSMSTPATYTGIMDSLRNIYVNRSESMNLNFDKSDFSYNTNGKCTKCNGKGSFELITNDEVIYELCDSCLGQRFNSKSLSIEESGITIGQTLTLSCKELYDIYSKDSNKKILTSKIGFINQIGLSYLKLGQPSGSLSGGESQRIKITKELSKKLGDRCLFILDSPAKGLHMLDLPLVLSSLRRLADKNNSIVIAENNPYFFNMSDWVIFLDKGTIKFSGSPHDCPEELYKTIKWE